MIRVAKGCSLTFDSHTTVGNSTKIDVSDEHNFDIHAMKVDDYTYIGGHNNIKASEDFNRPSLFHKPTYKNGSFEPFNI